MANSQRESEGASVWLDYQTILEIQEEGIVVLDQGGLVKYINPAATALLHLDPKDCLGKVFPFEIKLGSTVSTAVDDAEESWVQIRFKEVPWEDGSVYFAQVRDLSDRKREEELLQQAVEAAETRATELEALKFVADQLNQSALLEEAIQSGLETVLALVDAQAAWVLLPEETGNIRMIASYSSSSILKSERRTLSPTFRCQGLDRVMDGELMEPELIRIARCMQEAGLSPKLADQHYTVPLHIHGAPIGVLNLVMTDEKELAPHDIRLLKTISQQFAIAIQRSMPLSTAATNKYGKTISDVSRTISSALDLPAVLQNVLKLAVELVGAEAGSLGLLNQNRVNLNFLSNLPETISQQNLVKAENVVWQVVEKSKSVLLAGDDLSRQLPRNFCLGAKSLILSPVVAGRKTLGILALYTLGEEKELNAFDQAIAESLGQQAGIAVQNAQLFFEVQQLTITDPLTGLNNQKSFINHAVRELERTWRYKRPLSMISLVIDDIRNLNDRFGREIGDRILHSLGRICTESLRRVDVVGRYTGNNFVILLPETELEGARDVAERLRMKVQSFRIDSPKGHVTFSISLGVAGLSENEVIDLERFIDRANQALYTAVQAGGNQTLVWESEGKIR
jgi:diguanylate cyclase (GGDEF)-like protein